MSKRAYKPTALRSLEGGRSNSMPKPERALAQEPKPKATAPRKPHGLDKDARYIWSQLEPVLLPLGLLSEADGPLFAGLCQCAARQEQIREALREDGNGQATMMTITVRILGRDRSIEEPIINPLITLERQNLETLRKIAKEFGLSPTARAGLVVGDGDDGDDFLDKQ